MNNYQLKKRKKSYKAKKRLYKPLNLSKSRSLFLYKSNIDNKPSSYDHHYKACDTNQLTTNLKLLKDKCSKLELTELCINFFFSISSKQLLKIIKFLPKKFIKYYRTKNSNKTLLTYATRKYILTMNKINKTKTDELKEVIELIKYLIYIGIDPNTVYDPIRFNNNDLKYLKQSILIKNLIHKIHKENNLKKKLLALALLQSQKNSGKLNLLAQSANNPLYCFDLFKIILSFTE